MPPPLTPDQYLESSTIPVVPASLAGPCSICIEPYTSPVVLACGHIFDRACLRSWLEQRASCPTCRAELVVGATAAHDSDAREEDDMTELFGSFALAPRPAYAGALVRVGRPVEEVRVDGRVVARGNVLTLHGARRLLGVLWHCTGVSLRRHSGFSGYAIGSEEAGDMDVEMLRSTIQRAMFEDVRIGEGSWAVLYDAARLMLVWHSMGRTGEARWRIEGGEEWPPRERFEDMVEELLTASREEGTR
jgi:hypothetical protein